MINIKKCKLNRNGNIKVGNIATWATLKGADEIYIDRLGCGVTGTCGKHCQGCTKNCYVNKSYRYSSVKYGHAIRTIAIREHLDELYTVIDSQIKKARKPFTVVRWNESGEHENAEQFAMLCKLAINNPNVIFYCYSKAYEIIIPALLAGNVPENLVILISIWHESGVTEFKQVAHLANVKAFVYMDGFDYSKYGIEIQTTCQAYDEHGKLNHDITCDKCKKCFVKSEKLKIIGCNDH